MPICALQTLEKLREAYQNEVVKEVRKMPFLHNANSPCFGRNRLVLRLEGSIPGKHVISGLIQKSVYQCCLQLVAGKFITTGYRFMLMLSFRMRSEISAGLSALEGAVPVSMPSPSILSGTSGSA